MKRKYEYLEGSKAKKNFEDAMRYAFSIPKEQAPPKPEPKRHRKSGKGAA